MFPMSEIAGSAFRRHHLLGWGRQGPELMLPMGEIAGSAFATVSSRELVAEACCLKAWLFTQLALRVCEWALHAIEALA